MVGGLVAPLANEAPLELPTRRTSIEGETYEGDRLLLSLAIAKKLYRCPGCGSPIGIGQEHVFVRLLDWDPPFDHEHWHSGCTRERIVRSLARSRPVAAPKPPRPKRRGRR